MVDFGRLDTLIKLLKSCISPRSANKNILPPWDTSRCGREVWEKTLECHEIVTVDFATQSASITIPLQNSAVGFRSPSTPGAQSPKSIFGGFFCARLAWLLQTVAGQGHLRVRRYLVAGLRTLLGPPPRFEAWLAGNKCKPGVQSC